MGVFLFQWFDVFNELIDRSFIQTVVDTANMSLLINQNKAFGVDKVTFVFC